jgi:DNA-binding transcriptional LysR family regulator
MRLEHLRFFCAVVDNGFSITRAAEVLHISQPAISKQIAGFELELGADLFIRVNGRLSGLTAAGQSTLARARRILIEIEDLLHLGKSDANAISGTLVIATTHTHARYTLLDIIKDFRLSYPQVHLHLVQANPFQVHEAIVSGTADIGISSERQDMTGLREYRGHDLRRSIIAPLGHPVFGRTPTTLRDLSKHSLLTLDFSFPGGRAVGEAFENAGIEPNIVMTATDADVIKSYVRVGLGVAVLPTVTFDRTIDQSLQATDVTHLFGFAPTFVLVRQDHVIRGFMAEFINRIVPETPFSAA